MKTWLAVAFGIVGGLLGAGVLLLVSGSPRGEAITLLPPPTLQPITVHVTGAVARPGVYSLPPKCRVQDAVVAAGGLSSQANAQSLNLAAFIQDGERIAIPTQPSARPSTGQSNAPRASSSPGEPSPAPATPGLIDINTASPEELESLPGIGPVTAQKIIAHREQYGPFAAIQDIDGVPGIGPATFEKIKDLITVGDSP